MYQVIIKIEEKLNVDATCCVSHEDGWFMRVLPFGQNVV